MAHRTTIRNLWLFAFAADITAVVAAYYTALLMRFHSAWGERFFSFFNEALGVQISGVPGDMHEWFYLTSAPRIIFLIAATVCALYALRDLYPGRRFIRPRPEAWNVVVANVIAIAIFYTYFYLRRNVFHPRSFFATLMVLNVVYDVSLRGVVNRLLQWLREHNDAYICRAVLLGRDKSADFLYGYCEGVHPLGIHIVDRLEPDGDASLGSVLEALETSAVEREADMLIVADKELEVGETMQILELSDRLDLSVKILSDKMNVLMQQARLPVDTILGAPLVHFEAPSTVRRFSAVRRVVAWLAAAALLVLALPVMGLVALVIRLTSHGPALFLQERIGVDRKPFRMLKFRTMHHRADELQAQVEEFNESGHGLFKIREDPRITRVGRCLRRFSLDELPQLINVMRGEMTIVGPRPLPRRDFENYYEEWHYGRHSGMPGLTCLWQVSGRSDLDFHSMCILDVFYLRNQSWVMDLRIVLKTFWVVLFAKGAY